MRRIAYSSRARRDLAGIVKYISDHNPAAASRVRERIVGVIVGLGAYSTVRRSRLYGVFEKVVPDLPYVIYYEVDPETVRIITVRHTSRKPIA